MFLPLREEQAAKAASFASSVTLLQTSFALTGSHGDRKDGITLQVESNSAIVLASKRTLEVSTSSHTFVWHTVTPSTTLLAHPLTQIPSPSSTPTLYSICNRVLSIVQSPKTRSFAPGLIMLSKIIDPYQWLTSRIGIYSVRAAHNYPICCRFHH